MSIDQSLTIILPCNMFGANRILSSRIIMHNSLPDGRRGTLSSTFVLSNVWVYYFASSSHMAEDVKIEVEPQIYLIKFNVIWGRSSIQRIFIQWFSNLLSTLRRLSNVIYSKKYIFIKASMYRRSADCLEFFHFLKNPPTISKKRSSIHERFENILYPEDYIPVGELKKSYIFRSDFKRSSNHRKTFEWNEI